ncbi:hypothetical protein WJX74_002095 [Apatococcus lobatus]|uniref:Uncharacterized protein n=1 Tax=Apatococcus lobatus TaxID=904363 RepID=A0AAW1RJL8_9CHLO
MINQRHAAQQAAAQEEINGLRAARDTLEHQNTNMKISLGLLQESLSNLLYALTEMFDLKEHHRLESLMRQDMCALLKAQLSEVEKYTSLRCNIVQLEQNTQHHIAFEEVEQEAEAYSMPPVDNL